MKKPKQKCIVLIDGSNFYFKLRDLGLKNLLDFDFQSFIKDLSGKYKCIEAVYFIGKIRTDGSKKSNYLLSQQQKLLQHLSNNKINYKLGYLLKYKDNIFRY